MSRKKKFHSVEKHKKALLKHYRRNQKVALEALEGHIPLEEFCWMALSWRTMQMVADVGKEDAAAMFDRWANEIRRGAFLDCDGMQMSEFKDLQESLIYH